MNYEDSVPYKDYDFICKDKLYLAKVTTSSIEPERIIFQALLTVAREKESFLCYIADTPSWKKCIYGYELDTRYLYEIKEKPDKYPEELYQQYKPKITSILRDLPTQEELDRLIKLKEDYSKLDNDEYRKRTIGFGKLFNKELIQFSGLKEDDEVRYKTGAFYTPQKVCDQIKSLVDKYWTYEKVLDPCAGDGHLAKTFTDQVILCDINPKITSIGGLCRNSFQGTFPKEFDPVKDIIVTNIPYSRKYCKIMLDTCRKYKARIAIIDQGAHFPIEKMPLIDGFFTTGWGSDEGQMVLLFDYSGNTEFVSEKVIDGWLFQCEAPKDAIVFPGRDRVRCNMDTPQMIVSMGKKGICRNRGDLKKFSPGEFVTTEMVKKMRPPDYNFARTCHAFKIVQRSLK